ncbi:dienelactone hydrolase family protein [Gordonia aichiensis]|uniref:Putative hydrolase n=1 Tax=Gordonia aichiensis NBRC 108223 TaxID=1220583 RepID=L7KPA2_9ACTN|nr:dienelactone hydrolase family protein [Gordonia aichiensis]GAC50336.1 putative hydrolase [Gordonia aichiensis NBRC 108223]
MTDTEAAPVTTHGEDIVVTAADGDAEAYLVGPDDDADHPGVLFVIDAIGLRRQTRRMADRIASWGYVVLVPNVFYRWGTAAETSPDDDLLDDDTRAAFFAEAMPRVHALTDDLAEPDLSAYIDALRSMPGVSSGPIGVTGYCMGGRLALLAAAIRPDDVAALGMFHTGGLITQSSDSPHLRLGSVDAQVLAVHADRDRSLPSEAVAQFEHALITAGVTHSATVYPGAEHGYTMADTAVYNHDASEYHFTQLRKLFAHTLH